MIRRSGRPLRFVGMLGGGWVMLRVTLAMQDGASLIDAARDVLPIPVPARALPSAFPARPALKAPSWLPTGRPRHAPALAARTAVPHWPMLPGKPPPRDAAPSVEQQRVTAAPRPTPIIGDRLAVVRLPEMPRGGRGRFSVSSWLIARPGMGAGAATFAPQLGGSQAGIRVDYTLTKGIAATARVTTPARGIGREVALGFAWRPAGVPLRIVIEQRIALDAGRGGPSIAVSGGASAVPLPAGFRLEGYGQAGMIVRDGVERFADGSGRATRAVSEGHGIDLDLGIGAWGGAQRGAARLDIGPTLGARIPVAGQRVRVALDWRQRIAGNARPGSGPALSMGLDF